MSFEKYSIVPGNKTTVESRQDVTTETFYTFRNGMIIFANCLVASNMSTIGTFEMAKSLSREKCITVLSKHYSAKQVLEFCENSSEQVLDYVALSTGISTDEIKKVEYLLGNTNIKIVCFDCANGHMKSFINACKNFKKKYPQIILIAGNVATYAGYSALDSVGVDIVKIGIAGGSVCTTAKVTGIHLPQFEVISKISRLRKLHRKKSLIMSDGGCKVPGDICKLLVKSSDFVMIGGMLSGTEEMGGDLVIEDYKKYKLFYGMASEHALKKYNTIEEYRSAEGTQRLVEITGSASKVIKHILGGIRSCCSYVGVFNAKDLKKAKIKKIK
jgi:GMP reductase